MFGTKQVMCKLAAAPLAYFSSRLVWCYAFKTRGGSGRGDALRSYVKSLEGSGAVSGKRPVEEEEGVVMRGVGSGNTR